MRNASLLSSLVGDPDDVVLPSVPVWEVIQNKYRLITELFDG